MLEEPMAATWNSGALVIAFAVLYLGPLTLLGAVTGLAFWRHWGTRWYLQVAVFIWPSLAFFGMLEKW
jgi:hypothetical protein